MRVYNSNNGFHLQEKSSEQETMLFLLNWNIVSHYPGWRTLSKISVSMEENGFH